MGNSAPKARPGASLPKLVASLGTDLSGVRLGVSVPVPSGLPVYQVTVQRWLVCVCVCPCSLSLLKELGGALALSEQRRTRGRAVRI